MITATEIQNTQKAWNDLWFNFTGNLKRGTKNISKIRYNIHKILFDFWDGQIFIILWLMWTRPVTVIFFMLFLFHNVSLKCHPSLSYFKNKHPSSSIFLEVLLISLMFYPWYSQHQFHRTTSLCASTSSARHFSTIQDDKYDIVIHVLPL